MRLLTTPTEIHAALKALIARATGIEAAAAWASVGFDAYDLLVANRRKIRRLIVGMHFHQTHPDFIKEFLSDESVRFVLSMDGTFHPKAYLFELAGGAWQCVIGSPNFTQSAFEKNAELAVVVESTDADAGTFKDGLRRAFDGWWEQGKQLSSQELAFYREQWRKNHAALARRAGTFGKKSDSGIKPDGGAPVLDIPVCRMTWGEFCRQAKVERDVKDRPSFRHRLKIIKEVRKLFDGFEHFRDMPEDNRKEVAGLMRYDDLDFGWFGSMAGAGRFKSAIRRNDRAISRALDLVPLDGEITRDKYLAYVEEFKKAFPAGGHGVATATRLLAMKRPDIFVCLDNANRQKLCRAFKIRQGVDYEVYWDSIIERIRTSNWWNADRPGDRTESQLWDARAAFLDALYYDSAAHLARRRKSAE